MNYAFGTSSCRTRQGAQGGGFGGDVESLHHIPLHAACSQHHGGMQQHAHASSAYEQHPNQQHHSLSSLGEWRLVGLLCVCSCCLFGLILGLAIVLGLAVSGNLPTATPALALSYSNPATTAPSTEPNLASSEASSQLISKFAALHRKQHQQHQQQQPGSLVTDEDGSTSEGVAHSTLALSRATELFPEWSVTSDANGGKGGVADSSQPDRDWDADRALRDVVLAVSILAAQGQQAPQRSALLAPSPPAS